MANKIALLHFLPLELYPPVMNFINEAGANELNGQLLVYTTNCPVKELSLFTAPASSVRIKRFGGRQAKKNRMSRLVFYLWYNIRSIGSMIVNRPASVFYIETLSAFPAWVYKTFINPSCNVFIHYHEYMTPAQYDNGMTMLKWFHRLEKKLFPKASWLSHTNQERMDLFVADMKGINIINRHILPNYPPKKWYTLRNKTLNKPVRFIQVGALGLDSMYVKEFASWIVSQNGNAIWDIYALTIGKNELRYLEALNSPFIQFKGQVDYQQLPSVLAMYDVGVILYKGQIPNFVFNAPNKLFEYYTCGLDVWFPAQMVTACHYATTHTYPQVKPVLFEQLPGSDLSVLTSRENLLQEQKLYCAENALQEIIRAISRSGQRD